MSSIRKRSNEEPEPGRTITLGPVGMTVQAPSNKARLATPHFRKLCFAFISALRLRQNLLPALWAFLDIRVVTLRTLAVIPILLRRNRLGCRLGLLDIDRRRGRRPDNDLRRIVIRWRIPDRPPGGTPNRRANPDIHTDARTPMRPGA